MTTQKKGYLLTYWSCSQLAWDFSLYRLGFPLAAAEAGYYVHLSRGPLHHPNGTGRVSPPNKPLQ